MEIGVHSPALSFEGLTLTLVADFVAGRGMTCICGASGCGKTSLVRAILGFVPLVGGSISVDGETLTAERAWVLRRRTAYVPQELMPPAEWVREMVEAPFALAATRKSLRASEGHRALTANEDVRTLKANDCVSAHLQRLGLDERVLEQRVAELSGGQRSRVALAVAAALDRELLVADEPTAALDADSAERVIDALCEEAKRRTVIVVTHDDKFKKTDAQWISLL